VKALAEFWIGTDKFFADAIEVSFDLPGTQSYELKPR